LASAQPLPLSCCAFSQGGTLSTQPSRRALQRRKQRAQKLCCVRSALAKPGVEELASKTLLRYFGCRRSFVCRKTTTVKNEQGVPICCLFKRFFSKAEQSTMC